MTENTSKRYLTDADEKLMDVLLAASEAYREAYRNMESYNEMFYHPYQLDEATTWQEKRAMTQVEDERRRRSDKLRTAQTNLMNAAQDVASMWKSRQIPF